MQLKDLNKQIQEIANKIRTNQLGPTGNIYTSLGLLMSVWEAKCLDLDHIDVVEFGVANGNGLISLIEHANVFSNTFEIGISVTGFDTGTGMPAPTDYKDHPELWKEHGFSMDVEMLEERINNRATLILGNVKDTVPVFCQNYTGVLGFVSVDVDQYTSTKDALRLFLMESKRYLPAMPCYFDDVDVSFMFNPHCGEELAINEFNQQNSMRKICRKSEIYRIPNLYALHVLDHPVCAGTVAPAHPLSMQPF